MAILETVAEWMDTTGVVDPSTRAGSHFAAATGDTQGTALRAIIRDCVEQHTTPAPDPSKPEELAHAFVLVGRQKKYTSARLRAAQAALNAMIDPILDHMLHRRWPVSGKVDGANLHRKKELYASPAVIQIDGEDVHDHDALTRVIRSLIEAEPDNNWESLLPSKVNGSTLAANFREALEQHEFTPDELMLPVEDRLVIAGIPQSLVEASKITEKYTVNANGL